MGRYLDLAKAVKSPAFCEKWPLQPCLGEIEPKCEGSTQFEPDTGYERNELNEKRSGTQSYEKNEIRSAPDLAICLPGGHAVLLQIPDGVPADWAQGVADLLAMPPHPTWPEPGWKTLREDALRFLKDWAAQAHAFGWEALDLFGVHAVASRARLDGMGLVPLLDGRPVVALSEDSAAITACSGAMMTYRRKKAWPPGRCLIWELEGLL